MGAAKLTAGITAIANLLANDLSAEEIALLASVFVELGDTLATIAAERALCTNKE